VKIIHSLAIPIPPPPHPQKKTKTGRFFSIGKAVYGIFYTDKKSPSTTDFR